MSSWKFTPLERGFDSYYGYLGGGEDYWQHGAGGVQDLWDGRDPALNVQCSNGDACADEFYSATIFTREAIKVITAAAAAKTVPKPPLFLYLAYQSVHSPDQAPQHLIDQFNATINNTHRRTFAGMVAALDLGVGLVVDSLKSTGLYDTTLIVFTTDNGGPADGFNGNMACNYPLRGTKRTLFEGGVRGVGFVHGAGLQKTGWRADGYVHASDWFHTLLRFAAEGIVPAASPSSLLREEQARAGEHRAAPPAKLHQRKPAAYYAEVVRSLLPVDEPPFLDGDGVDVWEYLSGVASESPRREVLNEAHPTGSTDGNGEGLIVGDMKIVIRSGNQWSTGQCV